MEKVDLERYEITGRLGSGADYDVKAATDRETGLQVAIKRPVPQAISRNQHQAIEARTEKILQDLVGQLHLRPKRRGRETHRR